MKQLTDHQNLIPSEKQAEALALEHFGLNATARKMPGELDFNYHLTASDGSEFTLKIAPPRRKPGAPRHAECAHAAF